MCVFHPYLEGEVEFLFFQECIVKMKGIPKTHWFISDFLKSMETESQNSPLFFTNLELIQHQTNSIMRKNVEHKVIEKNFGTSYSCWTYSQGSTDCFNTLSSLLVTLQQGNTTNGFWKMENQHYMHHFTSFIYSQREGMWYLLSAYYVQGCVDF